MPRKPRTPSLRRHAPINRAVVTLKDYYLGHWPAPGHAPPEVASAYHKLLGDWEALGRRQPGKPVSNPVDGAPSGVPSDPAVPANTTVNELMVPFWTMSSNTTGTRTARRRTRWCKGKQSAASSG